MGNQDFLRTGSPFTILPEHPPSASTQSYMLVVLPRSTHLLLLTKFVFLDVVSPQEFESRLELVLHSLGVNSVPITMSNTTWDIPVNQYGKFNAAVLNQIFAAIELVPYDYVFITMLPDMEVRIVVFRGIDDAERIYGWFGDN